MMNLTAALHAARSSILAKSLQTAVAAENITNVDNPNYTRRETATVGRPGGVQTVSVNRVENAVLLRQFLELTSGFSKNQAIAEGLGALERTVGDPQSEHSPAALLAKFENALQSFSTLPHDPVVAQSAVQAAIDLSQSLNEASALVQQVRADADQQIGNSVNRINSLLEEFHHANNAVALGNGGVAELTAHLDTRDRVLAELAEEMDIKTVTGPRNDIAIYTKSGAVLYETKPRVVAFQPTTTFTASTTGNQVFIDGVPVTDGLHAMGLNSGKLKGLVELRDTVTVSYQSQLDEMARGLIEAFAEQDQSPVPSLPDVPGLFSYPGAPAMPASGVLIPGLAAQITVNANVDPSKGGDVFRLRDGAISDPGNASYLYNTTGATGFSDRLLELHDAMGAARSFDPAGQIETSASLRQYGTSSISWFEGTRRNMESETEYSAALLARSSESLSRATGVDLDTELSVMMDLERSYEASARLLSTIDSMFSTLLSALR